MWQYIEPELKVCTHTGSYLCSILNFKEVLLWLSNVKCVEKNPGAATALAIPIEKRDVVGIPICKRCLFQSKDSPLEQEFAHLASRRLVVNWLLNASVKKGGDPS